MVGRIVKDSIKYLGIRTEAMKDGGIQHYQKEYIEKLEQVEILVENIEEKLFEYGLSIH